MKSYWDQILKILCISYILHLFFNKFSLDISLTLIKKVDNLSNQISELEVYLNNIQNNLTKYPINISSDPIVYKRPWQVIIYYIFIYSHLI